LTAVIAVTGIMLMAIGAARLAGQLQTSPDPLQEYAHLAPGNPLPREWRALCHDYTYTYQLREHCWWGYVKGVFIVVTADPSATIRWLSIAPRGWTARDIGAAYGPPQRISRYTYSWWLCWEHWTAIIFVRRHMSITPGSRVWRILPAGQGTRCRM
jgi:hypothetical protein